MDRFPETHVSFPETRSLEVSGNSDLQKSPETQISKSLRKLIPKVSGDFGDLRDIQLPKSPDHISSYHKYLGKVSALTPNRKYRTQIR